MKLFSPVSLVIFIIAVFIVFGSGCDDAATELVQEDTMESKPAGIPMLDILEPGLQATITDEKLNISGTTDQEKVYIMNTPFDASDGNFSATISLEPGVHMVPVSVGNGKTTTTISLQITRE